jgi:hypothetical protein
VHAKAVFGASPKHQKSLGGIVTHSVTYAGLSRSFSRLLKKEDASDRKDDLKPETE